MIEMTLHLFLNPKNEKEEIRFIADEVRARLRLAFVVGSK